MRNGRDRTRQCSRDGSYPPAASHSASGDLAGRAFESTGRDRGRFTYHITGFGSSTNEAKQVYQLLDGGENVAGPSLSDATWTVSTVGEDQTGGLVANHVRTALGPRGA